MGILKNRSDYFENMASRHKLVAHNREEAGDTRLSFFRLNDEEELLTACVNFIHFPCVVHFDFSTRYTSGNQVLTKRKIRNELLFLDKAEDAMNMDHIAAAKDRAFSIGEDFISFLLNDFRTLSCGPFDNFDLARCSLVPYGPVYTSLYGWLLQFEDEQYAENITSFDNAKWYE